MLYLIDIHWERITPDPDRPSKGHSTYAIPGRSLIVAQRKAQNRFNHQCGRRLRITAVTEKQDPAGIFTNSQPAH